MCLPCTPSFRLDGKCALVTGASSGIGLGAATALAEYGAHVILSARNSDTLEKFSMAIRERGYKASLLKMDVTNISETQATVAEIGSVDILVNSAGIACHGPAVATKEYDFDAVANLNLKGAYFLTQAVARKLIKNKKPGSLINISSQMAHIGGIDRAVYCATKHAVEGFTKSMAIEFGRYNIRVNTICPTFIETPLTRDTLDNPERMSWIKEKIKLGRIGKIEDIMGAVVYLASDASALVTGTSLLIDGGWTAG